MAESRDSSIFAPFKNYHTVLVFLLLSAYFTRRTPSTRFW